jgi:hypothetical protein
MNITLYDKPSEPLGFSTNGVRFQLSLRVESQTVKSSTTQIEIQPVPESFLKGLADCEAGRVVDMERALEEPPQNNA